VPKLKIIKIFLVHELAAALLVYRGQEMQGIILRFFNFPSPLPPYLYIGGHGGA